MSRIKIESDNKSKGDQVQVLGDSDSSSKSDESTSCLNGKSLSRSRSESQNNFNDLFSRVVQEKKRLHMVNVCQLMTMTDYSQFEDNIDDHLGDLSKAFPAAACLFVTVFGKDEYRTLSARYFNDVGESFLNTVFEKSKDPEFGRENLNCCQYICEIGQRAKYHPSLLPTFMELYTKNQGMFRRAHMVTDIVYERFVEESKVKGTWDQFADLTLIANCSNMFEIFTLFGFDYIGNTMEIKGQKIGVTCLLYRREGNQPSDYARCVMDKFSRNLSNQLSFFAVEYVPSWKEESENMMNETEQLEEEKEKLLQKLALLQKQKSQRCLCCFNS